MPVRAIDVKRANADHEENGDDFDAHHRRVERGALLDAFHQDDGHYSNDYYSWKVDIRARMNEKAVLEAPGAAPHGRRQNETHFREHVLKVSRPAGGHGRTADCIFEDEVPADDPREQLAKRGVCVRVRRSSHRHHRRELRIAERGEHARDAGNSVGKHQSRAADVVRRSARGDENARADDGANAEAGELNGTEDAAEPVLALHFLEQQLERFTRKKPHRFPFPDANLTAITNPPNTPSSPDPTRATPSSCRAGRCAPSP